MRAVAIPIVILLAGCAAVPVVDAPATSIAPFSAGGETLPKGWQPLIINRTKTPTEYRLARDPVTREIVLHATADAAASGLRQQLDVDPGASPVVRWRWRVVDLIVGADNQDRYAEDSPVRLMLFFDGDKSALPHQGADDDGDRQAADRPGAAVLDADVHLGEPVPGGHGAAEQLHFAGEAVRGRQRTRSSGSVSGRTSSATMSRTTGAPSGPRPAG